MRVLTIILVSVVLTACAATPKPELPDSDYQPVANDFVTIDKCNAKGYMPVDTAASGLLYLNRKLERYSFNRDKLLSTPASNTLSINKEYCNKIALIIQSEKQRLDRINQANSIVDTQEQGFLNGTINQQRSTYCNHIGSQILCTTH